MILLLTVASLAAEPAPEPTSVPVPVRMAQHVALVQGMHDAVIQGDAEGARGLAAELARLDPASLPNALRVGLVALSAEAGRVGAAPDAPQTAAAVAQVLGVCAGCHSETGGGPRLNTRAVPPAEFAADSPMPQHQWAVDWLFIGIVAGDDAGWARGAKALTEAPILAAEATRPESFAALEASLRKSAAEAASATQPGDRVKAYGQVIGQCAACHMALEGEGATPR
ncbi:MAG: cytochrome c553 [Myxococcota bacterium]|jgi:cytochrome c553